MAEYGKRSNYISRSLSYDPNGVTIRSQSTNFQNFERLDITVVTPLKVMNNWDIQLMMGANYTKYPISESGVENNIKRRAALVSVQQQIKFLKHYSADISLKYTSQELRGVYLTNDVFFMDLGVKRSFFNNKLDVAISLNDVFNTYQEKGYSQSNLTNYHYNDKPDSRRFGLTLKYNFGGNLINGNKNKTDEQERL